MDLEPTTCPPVGGASGEPDTLAMEVATAVMRTSRRLRVDGTGMTPGQYAVLAHISGGPRSLRELADREQVQAPTMTRIVNALAERGFVSRLLHPEDRRRVQISITPAGETALVQGHSQRNEWLDRRVAGLSEGDRITLSRAASILQELSAR